MSYPLTGSTGDGYKMAAALGHTVTELKPSLIPLTVHEGFVNRLSGLSLKTLRFRFMRKERKARIQGARRNAVYPFRNIGSAGIKRLLAYALYRKKQYTAFIDLKRGLAPNSLITAFCAISGKKKTVIFSNSA